MHICDILKLCICWLGEGGEVEREKSFPTSSLGYLSKVTALSRAEKYGEGLALGWVGWRGCDLERSWSQ